MKMIVTNHLIRYGPNGVPKGFVDTQNSVYGSTPCLQSHRSLVSLYLSNTQKSSIIIDLPSNFADETGLADEDSKEITKGAYQHQRIQGILGTTLAKHGSEEDGRRDSL